MAKTRIKVSCAGVLDRACVPTAVVVADVKIGKDAARYVLLDFETRSALSHMCDEYCEITNAVRIREDHGHFPQTIRSHAFDASGEISDGLPLQDRRGNWTNAEHLWVRADLAAIVLEKLAVWRERFPRHHACIHAPSWIAFHGCQALALAAGLPLPAIAEAA